MLDQEHHHDDDDAHPAPGEDGHLAQCVQLRISCSRLSEEQGPAEPCRIALGLTRAVSGKGVEQLSQHTCFAPKGKDRLNISGNRLPGRAVACSTPSLFAVLQCLSFAAKGASCFPQWGSGKPPCLGTVIESSCKADQQAPGSSLSRDSAVSPRCRSGTQQ